MAAPKFRKGNRVHAAGLRGSVVCGSAGVTGDDQVHGEPARLVSVQWDGEAGPVSVREDLLTRIPARRKAAVSG